jgi:3-(3-hydroxy-phenyl)propionate hydroxylase
MLSDDALGHHWAFITFGVDPTVHVRPELIERWSLVGGKVWQWCHRARAQHLAPAAGRL